MWLCGCGNCRNRVAKGQKGAMGAAGSKKHTVCSAAMEVRWFLGACVAVEEGCE